MAPSVGLATGTAQLENLMAISKFGTRVSKFGRCYTVPYCAVPSVLGFVQTTRESSPAKNKLSSPLVDKIGGQHTSQSATAQTVFYVVIFAHACVN